MVRKAGGEPFICDADVIISMPAMKTHMMTGVTLGMKNMYGTLPEIDKARYHKIGIDSDLPGKQSILWNSANIRN